MLLFLIFFFPDFDSRSNRSVYFESLAIISRWLQKCTRWYMGFLCRCLAGFLIRRCNSFYISCGWYVRFYGLQKISLKNIILNRWMNEWRRRMSDTATTQWCIDVRYWRLQRWWAERSVAFDTFLILSTKSRQKFIRISCRIAVWDALQKYKWRRFLIDRHLTSTKSSTPRQWFQNDQKKNRITTSKSIRIFIDIRLIFWQCERIICKKDLLNDLRYHLWFLSRT